MKPILRYFVVDTRKADGARSRSSKREREGKKEIDLEKVQRDGRDKPQVGELWSGGEEREREREREREKETGRVYMCEICLATSEKIF